MSATAMAAAPGAADGAVAVRLLDAARALIDVLAAENAALAARDGEALRALVARKTAAVASYEKAMAAFAALAPKPATIAPAVNAALREAAGAVATLAGENGFRLEVARAAQRRLVEHMVEAARSAAPRPATYARDGVAGAPARGRAPAAASISVDRAL